MHLLLGLRRLALSIVDHALQLPAIVLGSRGEALDRLPRITAGPGVPDDKRPAASLHLRTDVTGAAAVCVSTGTAWGAPIEEVETAAGTAQTAAEAAQDTADGVRTDFDALSDLIGDIGTVVGPEAPPGYPATLTAGFVQLITDINGKLSTSSLRAGSVTITAAATSGTFDLGNGWNNKAVFVGPAANPGLSAKWWGSVTAGVVTVSVDVAPGADKTFWFLVADVS